MKWNRILRIEFQLFIDPNSTFAVPNWIRFHLEFTNIGQSGNSKMQKCKNSTIPQWSPCGGKQWHSATVPDKSERRHPTCRNSRSPSNKSWTSRTPTISEHSANPKIKTNKIPLTWKYYHLGRIVRLESFQTGWTGWTSGHSGISN